MSSEFPPDTKSASSGKFQVGIELVGINVAGQMVNADKRLSGQQRQGLSRLYADMKAADQAGALGDGNQIDIVPGQSGIRNRLNQ